MHELEDTLINFSISSIRWIKNPSTFSCSVLNDDSHCQERISVTDNNLPEKRKKQYYERQSSEKMNSGQLRLKHLLRSNSGHMNAAIPKFICIAEDHCAGKRFQMFTTG